MDKHTCQQIIYDLVNDVHDTLQSEPNADTCKWWRGRISGVTDTCKILHNELDYKECDAALEALYYRETETAA